MHQVQKLIYLRVCQSATVNIFRFPRQLIVHPVKMNIIHKSTNSDTSPLSQLVINHMYTTLVLHSSRFLEQKHLCGNAVGPWYIPGNWLSSGDNTN